MSKESFESGIAGVALEDSKPHPTKPNTHTVRMSLPTVNTREQMQKFDERLTGSSSVEFVHPQMIEVMQTGKGEPVAINPRYIRFAKPAYRAFDAPARTIINVEGIAEPVLADIDYEEFAALWRPYVIFNSAKT